MDFTVVFQVLVLFIVLGVGAVCRKQGMFPDGVIASLSKLVLYVSQPALTLAAFSREFPPEMAWELVQMFLISMVAHIITFGLGLLLFRRQSKTRKAVLVTLMMLCNSAFMGYPVITAAFGQEALLYAVTYGIGFNICAWTLGVWLFAGAQGVSVKKALINPGLLSVFIGAALLLFKLRLPGPVRDAITMLGSLTTPLAMMLIGARMVGVKLNDLRDPPFFVGILCRLIAIPLLFYMLLKPLGLPPMVFKVSILVLAMPGATMLQLFAEEYKGDAPLASRATFVSTLLSILTIPAIVMLLG